MGVSIKIMILKRACVCSIPPNVPTMRVLTRVSHQVDSRPREYPRYSALIGSSNQFHICRRFSWLRSRLLLSKQDQLVRLERQLEHVDQDKACPLFLASQRRDKNVERRSLLAEINVKLAEYGWSIFISTILPFETQVLNGPR